MAMPIVTELGFTALSNRAVERLLGGNLRRVLRCSADLVPAELNRL